MALSSSQIYVATYRATATLDRSTLTPSVNQRTRPQDSANGSRWRFGRSTTNLRDPESRSSSTSTPSNRVPSPNPSTPKQSLERSSSKMSLFNLFSRPKVEKARGHTEVGMAVPSRPQTPPKSVPVIPPAKSSLRQNPTPAAQQTIRSRSSQMFRPMSMRSSPALAPSKEFGSWDPPPLFQAFPQSVKHATVQACVYSPEVLLRTQMQRRQAEALLERMDSVRDLSIITEDGSDAKRLEKTHRRLISNSVLNPPAPELSNKIYILVTAGYVLQYAGDGSFDRSPEKVLRLGKDSAAFACDLIPGKHWVLQISSHAHDDGTIESSPKSSLLSRLRSQNAIIRKSVTSFLLVLESAEEMDSWMMAVRKEIDNQGGTRCNPDSRRTSVATLDSREKSSLDTTSHRYHVRRDPNIPSKIGPTDSPLQSQYGSPQIITSDWESSRSERTTSVAESTSGQSYRYGNHRQSVESSLATPISIEQTQLDQLRGRPRFSYMSSATSASSPGTRNTSRDSSPIHESALVDGVSPVVEGETFRSATSLKSFHMNPGNSLSSRRRSMQPLPVTNENFTPLPKQSLERQRHSLFGPTSPKMADVDQPSTLENVLPTSVPAQRQSEEQIDTSTLPATSKSSTLRSASGELNPVLQTRNAVEDNSPRLNARKFSIPPRREVVSPPPRDPAPVPPPSMTRPFMIGNTPMLAMSSAASESIPTNEPRAPRRVSANPKPFLRPFPVRPQQQHADQARLVPRRLSSLTPHTKPAPLPLRVNVNRSVTAPIFTSTAAAPHLLSSSPSDSTQIPIKPDQPLNRPVSVQVRPRAQHSPPRPIRAVASTPSFVPSRRPSNPLAPPTGRHSVSQSNSNTSGLREFHAQQSTLPPRRSMGPIGLPPPMPPPDLPLPPPPPPSPPAATTAMLPGPPPNCPLPALPPPTTPLPSLPISAPREAIAS